MTELPAADLFLCFNMFGYFERKGLLLRRMKERLLPNGSIVIRQYDGATMRLGRMHHEARLRIDMALYAGVGASRQFGHYAMDDTLGAVADAGFPRVEIEFETFFRLSPFSDEFQPYLQGTLEWITNYVGDAANADVRRWFERATRETLHYFSEIDVVCWIS